VLELIAGTCAIESEDMTLRTADALRRITDDLNMSLIYKGSFDKANRTSLESPRGVGMDEGLRILEKVRNTTGLQVLTDVHDITQIEAVAQAVDILQTPAFLCRQTDFIQAVAKAGRPVNIKKGQFLAPKDMFNVVEKAKTTGNDDIWGWERGTSFGYHDLVSDMRSLVELQRLGCPVVYDATHSVQRPSQGGDRRYIAPLARAAVAVGIDKLFMEVHPRPSQALSDPSTSYLLDEVKPLLEQLLRIEQASDLL